MKHNLKIVGLIIATILLVGGCASTSNSEDYFGYNNNPKPIVKEITNDNKAEVIPVKTQDDWVNPFSEDYTEQTGAENVTIVNQYVYPSYVPVIVPWWDRYYGNYSRPRSGIYISYYPRYYWGWDWYWHSPYYDYHPYYGHHVSYHPWWYDNYWYGGNVGYAGYSYSKNTKTKKVKSVRNFGPSRGGAYTPSSRGSTTSHKPSGTRSSSRTGTTSTTTTSSNTNKIYTTKSVSPKSTSVRSSSRTTNTSTRYLPNKGESTKSATSTGSTYKPSGPSYTPRSTRSTKSSGSSYTPSSSGSSRSSGTSTKSSGSSSSKSSGSSYTPSSSSGSSSSGSSTKSSGSSSSSKSSAGSSRSSRRK